MVPDDALPAELRRYAAAGHRAAGAARECLAGRPALAAAALALLGLGVAAYRLFAPLPADTWPVLGDSVIFEYIGWFLTRGNRLYVDIWEVKPPLAFEVTALLALLAGDSVVGYHVLNLLANAAAVAAGAAAAAGIVRELTDDALGAVVAGVAPFALPMYFYRALVGFKSKYVVVAAGLGCLYLAYRDRPVAAGVAGAAAVGFWQLAAVFPLCALGLGWQRGGRDGAGRVVLGGVATGAVVLLPVLYWGVLPAMIAEVVLAPLLLSEGHAFADRVQYIVRVLGLWLPVALVGLAGLAGSLVPRRLEREWPLLAVAGWFTVQMVALDFDNPPDLFPWLATVSLGVGLVVGRARRRGAAAGLDAGIGADTGVGPGRHASGAARALAAVVLVLAALSVATMGGFGTGYTDLTSPETYDTGRELSLNTTGANTYNASQRQYLFWNRVEVDTCRAFGAHNQFQLVHHLGLAEDRRWFEAPCGQFDPAWRAVRDRYGL